MHSSTSSSGDGSLRSLDAWARVTTHLGSSRRDGTLGLGCLRAEIRSSPTCRSPHPLPPASAEQRIPTADRADNALCRALQIAHDRARAAANASQTADSQAIYQDKYGGADGIRIRNLLVANPLPGDSVTRKDGQK